MENSEHQTDGPEMERYGTITNWSRELGVSPQAIQSRLNGTKGITGMDASGQLHEHGYFSESEIRHVCEELLSELPQVDEDSFYREELDGEKKVYASRQTWANTLGLSMNSINSCLKNLGGIQGRDRTNKKRILYEESKVRNACEALLEDLPIADRDGFVDIGGVKHASLERIAGKFGMAPKTVFGLLGDVPGVRARQWNRQIRMFYPELAVSNLLRPDIHQLPQADEEGIIVIENVRYSTLTRWSKILGRYHKAVVRHMDGLTGITGRDFQGQVRENAFFQESLVREKCGHASGEFPESDQNGIIVIDGVRYATVKRWTEILNISRDRIIPKCKNVRGIKGRNQSKHVLIFFPENEIRECCEDILSPVHDGK